MTLYCKCVNPIIDVMHDAGCRRCGRPVDFSPAAPNGALASRHVDNATPAPDGCWPMRVPTAAAVRETVERHDWSTGDAA